MATQVKYDVRCFRRKVKGKQRYGIWVMTRPKGFRGVFIHGDDNAFYPPDWTVETLARVSREGKRTPIDIDVEAITPEDVLADLSDWPEGRAEIQSVFDRHLIDG